MKVIVENEKGERISEHSFPKELQSGRCVEIAFSRAISDSMKYLAERGSYCIDVDVVYTPKNPKVF